MLEPAAMQTPHIRKGRECVGHPPAKHLRGEINP